MANEEQLAILKRGVDEWNRWRVSHPKEFIDLSGADLNFQNLRGVDLIGADLHGANLTEVNLRDAKLRGADLRGAYLENANLREADLTKADLTGAVLFGAHLGWTKLYDTNLNEVHCGSTIFAGVDLSSVVGLDTTFHLLPSEISIRTLIRSNGKIPEVFLRGCGVPEILITYLPSMLEDAMQFYSCFISYSHADQEFAQTLHKRLQKQGISCWLDEHQLKPGDKLHKTIYEAIRVYDKVILC